MSTDVQVSSKIELSSEKHPKKRSKDSEKPYSRRSSNCYNKKSKYGRKYMSNVPPTKFLLGGNITDPLNLNSLQDEDINRALNAVTPKTSPLSIPQPQRCEIQVIIPHNIADPLNLNGGDDDATYNSMLLNQKTEKKTKKHKRKRNHRTSTSESVCKDDNIEGAKTDPSPCKETSEPVSAVVKEELLPEPPVKRFRTDGNTGSARLSLPKEIREKRHTFNDKDRIVSPVVPQPGAWPGRRDWNQSNKTSPKFKEKDARFQYGNYSRYYGYRNPNHGMDIRLKLFAGYKHLFKGKDVLDIGCNTGHLTLVIARDFGPHRMVGLDIDGKLIDAARNNIKHYGTYRRVKHKSFPTSLPVVYGPIEVPGVGDFPYNVTFIQGNYVLESDVQLSMEVQQFDVILCLSITKWIQLNWGDAGLKRAFKRMYAQLRSGGVLILEAQSWHSYQKKKKLTPEIWNNFKAIELRPTQFCQFLLTEVGFSRTKVIGAPPHNSRGFQRPIRMFIKEEPPINTPDCSPNVSISSSVRSSVGNLGRMHARSWRNNHFPDDSSNVSSPVYAPLSFISSESGFSESIRTECIPSTSYSPIAEESTSNTVPENDKNNTTESKEIDDDSRGDVNNQCTEHEENSPGTPIEPSTNQETEDIESTC